ncbi:MAG: hypothetical protein WC285_00265 [Candidatus Gracilibacteria bacterium]|jgi:hypothetical protein
MKKFVVTFLLSMLALSLVGCGTPAPTADPTTTSTDKTFEGNGFTFTYPEKYTADDKGLWTEEGYKNHLNPPEACDTCQIPEIEVKVATPSNTVEQQILADYTLPGKTLAEMKEQTSIPYENVKIGDNDFTKITVSDLYDITGYYAKTVAFRVYFKEKDNQELKDIISTLKLTGE